MVNYVGIHPTMTGSFLEQGLGEIGYPEIPGYQGSKLRIN